MSDYNYCVWLSQGQVAFVDREDHWRVTRFKWSAAAIGRQYYAARAVDGKLQYLHRFIMDATQEQEVDHIDLNPLNCRRSNLRLATRSQNVSNRKKFIRGAYTSKYKGVHLRASGKWHAQITLGKQRVHLGKFATEEEAARVYDETALVLHGKFARLNFPEVA